MGGDEFLNGETRWCLWLVNAPPSLIRSDPEVERRVQSVRQFRSNSGRPQTRDLADTPYLFGEIRQPSTRYSCFQRWALRRVGTFRLGSWTRRDRERKRAHRAQCDELPFGVLSSAMHTGWLYYVGGRMKSDPQYSGSVVYNNYPWPTDATDAQKHAVEAAAQGCWTRGHSSRRRRWRTCTTRWRCRRRCGRAPGVGPGGGPCYRPQPFDSDRHRVEYLFGLYEKLTTLFAAAAKPKRGRKSKAPPPNDRVPRRTPRNARPAGPDRSAASCAAFANNAEISSAGRRASREKLPVFPRGRRASWKTPGFPARRGTLAGKTRGFPARRGALPGKLPVSRAGRVFRETSEFSRENSRHLGAGGPPPAVRRRPVLSATAARDRGRALYGARGRRRGRSDEGPGRRTARAVDGGHHGVRSGDGDGALERRAATRETGTTAAGGPDCRNRRLGVLSVEAMRMPGMHRADCYRAGGSAVSCSNGSTGTRQPCAGRNVCRGG
jgi:hypothetical protein